MQDDAAAGLLGWTVLSAVLLLYPVWRIHGRAGLNPGLALLVLIPVIGPLLCALVLAFVRWPVKHGAGTRS